MSTRATAIGRGVVVQVGGRVLALMASLVTVATSTKYLGPQQYGLLVGAIVIVGLYQIAAENGIDEVITRRVGRGAGELGPLAGTHLGIGVLIGPVVALLAVLTGLVLAADEPEQQLAIAIIAVGLVFGSIATCGNSVFQTTVRFGAVAFADVASRSVALVGTLVVAWLDLGLLAMAAVQVIHPFVRMVVSLYAAGRLQPWKIRFERAAMLSLVRESLPLTAMIFVGVLYYRSGGVLLQSLSDPLQVAAYGLALAIAGNLGVLPQVLGSTMLSTLAERYAYDRSAFVRTVRTVYRLMLVFMLPVAIFGWPLAAGVVELISGAEYVALAGPVLQLFFVGMAIGFLTPLLSHSLFAAGRQKFLLNFAFVTLGLNVALNLVLVPLLGAVGVGIALIASELLGIGTATYVLYREGVRLPDPIDVVRILPALSLGLAMLYILRDAHVLVSGLVVGVLYVAAVLATGALPATLVNSMLGRRIGPVSSEVNA